jgi:hypothetical protein
VLTVLCYYREPRRGNEAQGERSFWRWEDQGERYVRRMTEAVNRYVPGPHQLRLLAPDDAPGWWGKVQMFNPAVTEGRCLYLDLDNVIGGPLDALVALEPDPIIMADDRMFPGTPNGSVMLFDAGRLRFLWDEYQANGAAVRREFSESHWPMASDQAFIADRVRKAGHVIPFFQDLLPPGYLLMSQAELEQGADWSRTHLVCGQSLPKPHQSAHPYYAEHWRDAA